MQDKDRIYEEKRLDKTITEIDSQLEQMKLIEKAFTSNIRATFKNMWEEVDAAPNELKELEQLVQAKLYLDEMRNMETTYRSAAERIGRLERMKKNPYFARIDFVENGESLTEQIYIGISMIQNEESLEILVYDWRAPISGMFYDYDTGKAGFDSPSGRIEGELTLKRQFRIENGRIKYMFDSDVKIDDDILQEVLGQSKDEKMKTIITSIQREQNVAIRDEGHKLLIVEGPAGSGKTSIALHRVAFLLYRYRNHVTNANVLILSPNDMFNDYISEVLPELGEENVRQTTIMEFARSFLKTKLLIMDLNEQMEYILTGKKTNTVRIGAIEYKSSMEFIKKLQEYVSLLFLKPFNFEDFKEGNTTIISKEDQKELFEKEYTYLPLIPRLKKVRNRVLYLIKQQEYKKIKELIDKFNNDPIMADVNPIDRRRLAAKVIVKRFQPLRMRARLIGNVNVVDIYRQMFVERNIIPDELSNVSKFTINQLNKGVLLYEDLAPILYLKGKLQGVAKKDYIRHVIIDEAQDYTPLQMEVIRELFPTSNFTIVGDMNQSLNPYANIGSIDNLKAIFQTQSLSHIKFNKSYRSTHEITRFVNHILGFSSDGELINRNGELPELKLIASVEDCVEGLKYYIPDVISKGYRSVAVIAKNKDEAKNIYRQLKKHISCNLVVKPEAEFPRGTTVIPSYLAKGLEFDVVFALNLGSPYAGKEERNLFYTVCSRALHRLFVYSQNQLPEYFENIPVDAYKA